MLVTLTQYAKEHGIPRSTVDTKARRGGFRTAQKTEHGWVIDSEEPYVNGRIKSGLYAGWKEENAPLTVTDRKCLICGKPLTVVQKKYCSVECRGLGRQCYATCVICGKRFKRAPSSGIVCCSKECSRQHSRDLYYQRDDLYENMRSSLMQKMASTPPEKYWGAKSWVIKSPDGQVYKCRNLHNFIREHPDLFNGTLKQAYDGFQKMKQTQRGVLKEHKSYSWKGWTLLGWSDD